ncbi:hypothetical protein FQN51_002795 [Onygenales sp. PD_10]|nr:hypothetical protein FQN51_002795 [Onygenales sp. PD_10]
MGQGEQHAVSNNWTHSSPLHQLTYFHAGPFARGHNMQPATARVRAISNTVLVFISAVSIRTSTCVRFSPIVEPAVLGLLRRRYAYPSRAVPKRKLLKSTSEIRRGAAYLPHRAVSTVTESPNPAQVWFRVLLRVFCAVLLVDFFFRLVSSSTRLCNSEPRLSAYHHSISLLAVRDPELGPNRQLSHSDIS